MSLDKAIAHGKEHRRAYTGSRAFDPACRSGDCPWCRGNYTIRSIRARAKALDELRHDYRDEPVRVRNARNERGHYGRN